MQSAEEFRSNNGAVVIIGASHAGVNFAFNLLQQGWTGCITLIERDPELPYHRPPLSKKTLQSAELKSTPLKAEKAYKDNNIELKLGYEVTVVNHSAKQLTLNDGQYIHYDKLIIATGCRAFIPPISGMDVAETSNTNRSIFTMRTFADTTAIKAALNNSSDKQVVIIGGGYIGLESAASLIAMGAKVTVIEKQPKILSRVTSAVMSDFLTELHLSKGAEILTGKDVIEVKQLSHQYPHQPSHQYQHKQVVVCGDGSEYCADFIIVGVGVRLNSQLALDAGVEVEQGIKVNEACQTSNEDIFAIGDCTQQFSSLYQRWIRLESVQNAVDQAKIAAQFLTGKLSQGEPVQQTVPWFWSDQYNCKLQIVGLSDGYDELLVKQESVDQFSVWYFKADKLLCVEAVNYAKAYVLGTQAIKQNLLVDKTALQSRDALSKEILFLAVSN
ncbi:NAD(P)/FAD-dependent oxidoreductase [Shewanella sp. 10N.286.48.A6]|uniref:NAD(P)/FAD-dependent oxidoreductase n=1 Tax=Shewanella sp. 10N.286.48.A6 TaxID=1880833 RepID=UPI000C84B36C|nr:FAD-dependent oxidoreductase [Shewanella sp. 10N.286.48.A6]PMI02136.1 pyridine nucleotide-disulfide oxidoreductase [Shewanella sp. 10N.286.48.A6]